MLKPLIAPEKISTKESYAFSINYKDPLCACTWRDLLPLYVGFFQKLRKYANFEMIPELSSSGKLHYHGTLTPKAYSTIIPLYQLLNQTDASIELRQITNPHHWYIYIRKQQHLIRPLMERNLLPYKKKHYME